MGNVADEPPARPRATNRNFWAIDRPKRGERHGQIVIGEGATVAPDYKQFIARAWFLRALKETAPHVHEDLLQVRNLELAVAAFSDWPNGHRTGPPAAVKLLERAIQEWQAQHRLNEQWIMDAAEWTLGYAVAPIVDMLDEGLRVEDLIRREVPLFPGRTGEIGPWVDKIVPRRSTNSTVLTFTPEHMELNVPVYIDQLNNRPQFEDGDVENDGPFETFDPRTEDVDAATDRLLETLRPRVRRILESIVAEDRDLNGAQLPVTYRSTAPFEWLVRYQVLGESRNAIAKSIDVDRSHVGREIQRVADLIGLIPRKESGGRPRKPVR